VAEMLNTIGMGTFVEYYPYFDNYERSNTEIRALMVKRDGYAESSAQTKVSTGRRIFRENCASEALRIIINSKKIDDSLRNKALALLMPPKIDADGSMELDAD
jgi:hypothetical protein